MHVPRPGERTEGSVGLLPTKNLRCPSKHLRRGHGDNVLSYFRRPRRCRSATVLRTRLVEGEDIDRPLDICSLRGARETLRATTSRPFCDGATDFPQIRRSWTSPSLGRIHSRVWGQTHTRSSPATPPTIFYRGCLPAAPHASRATGPLGGLRLCPTETGVTVRPAADRFLIRGAIRPDGFGPRRQAGTAHKCAAFPYPPPGDARPLFHTLQDYVLRQTIIYPLAIRREKVTNKSYFCVYNFSMDYEPSIFSGPCVLRSFYVVIV